MLIKIFLSTSACLNLFFFNIKYLKSCSLNIYVYIYKNLNIYINIITYYITFKFVGSKRSITSCREIMYYRATVDQKIFLSFVVNISPAVLNKRTKVGHYMTTRDVEVYIPVRLLSYLYF